MDLLSFFLSLIGGAFIGAIIVYVGIALFFARNMR